MPADLLMIVPSRGRPHNIADLWDAWSATTTGAAELLVAADDDDPALDGYREVCAERGIELTVGPRLRMCPTLNKVALERAADHYAIGFLGDDHRPRTPAFDETYLAVLASLGGVGMVYGDDGYMGERLPTHVAMTANIIQTLGYMVPPGLLHLWADNSWLDLGRAIDRIRYLPDVLVEHMHPIAGKAEDDHGYAEVNHPDAAERDRQAYARWLETGFDADVAKLRALL
ncbi:hypothetical protein [Actinomadura decatromicini]|uniref:Glycosyltransferase n=1 Tax=Actinomadura decatromicini TaxID=2604572 RepID=A0A5D3FBG2_9ACTN|nr:hypothetical protein [Actinomadura decatromicini]TYK45176.1 hypothetical protein FXF68_31350 [Actinomadura decatromicini]